MSELARHALYGGAPLAVGLLLWASAWGLRRRRWAWPRWILGAPAVVAGAAVFAFMARPMPDDLHTELGPGVTYQRWARRSPERAVVHLVRVDLAQDGLQVFVTPPGPAARFQVPARTASEFLDAFGADLAVNASYFHPWHSNSLLDYYPHSGDPVAAIGPTVGRGQRYAPPSPGGQGATTLWLLPGRAELGEAERPEATDAVSGFPLLLAGRPLPAYPQFLEPGRRHPRVAAGLSDGGRTLWLLVVDGRQPLYSLGLDVPEVAEVFLERGISDALLLDGGGSATLALRTPSGPSLLNTPVHGRLPPGRERPVANHLGLVDWPANLHVRWGR